jgi:hypothetical protein
MRIGQSGSSGMLTNLQQREEGHQRLHAHLHHRRRVELTRVALVRRELETDGERRRIGQVQVLRTLSGSERVCEAPMSFSQTRVRPRVAARLCRLRARHSPREVLPRVEQLSW